MRADTPADAGVADGRRLAFRLALTRLSENERPREAIASRGRSFPTISARCGTDFQSHLRASAPGARAARPASARICVEVGFPRFCSSAAPPLNSPPLTRPAAKISHMMTSRSSNRSQHDSFICRSAYFRGAGDGKNNAAWPHAAPVAPCGQR
jgi:hypothetical protein